MQNKSFLNAFLPYTFREWNEFNSSICKALSEPVARRCSVKNVFLEILQNSQENNCARVSFLIRLQASARNFIKKETLAQVFSCEFCEILKKTFFTEHLQWLLLLLHINYDARSFGFYPINRKEHF